jgi:hypothetical protein
MPSNQLGLEPHLPKLVCPNRRPQTEIPVGPSMLLYGGIALREPGSLGLLHSGRGFFFISLAK